MKEDELISVYVKLMHNNLYRRGMIKKMIEKEIVPHLTKEKYKKDIKKLKKENEALYKNVTQILQGLL